MGAFSFMTKLTGDFKPDKMETYRMLSGLLQYAANNYNNSVTADVQNRYFMTMLTTEPEIGAFSTPAVTPAALYQQGSRKYIEVTVAAKTLMAITKADNISEARYRANRFVSLMMVLDEHLSGKSAFANEDAISARRYLDATKEDVRTAEGYLTRTQNTLDAMIEEYDWSSHLAFEWESFKPALVLY
jgi:hypothetical protein